MEKAPARVRSHRRRRTGYTSSDHDGSVQRPRARQPDGREWGGVIGVGASPPPSKKNRRNEGEGETPHGPGSGRPLHAERWAKGSLLLGGGEMCHRLDW